MSTLGFHPGTILTFAGLAITALAIDLYAHRADKPISLKSASLWSIFWILVATIYGIYLHLQHGSEIASLFFTGYVLEKTLSVDNLFVMMAIFSWFSVPEKYRHRVLYWGIIGAIVFRGIFVAIGTGLLALGPWIEMLFAAIVAYTAIMMLRSTEDDDEIEDYSNHLAYRSIKRFFPLWPRIYGHNFFISRQQVEEEMRKPENKDIQAYTSNSSYWATPLMLCLAVIELSDVMFAFDSVPAVIAVSREPIIVYSAMIFAILGLRTMYFVLEALKQYLVHLEKAVIVLLFFIAGKLALNASSHIFHHDYSISATQSLCVVLGVLSLGIFSSLALKEKAG